MVTIAEEARDGVCLSAVKIECAGERNGLFVCTGKFLKRGQSGQDGGNIAHGHSPFAPAFFQFALAEMSGGKVDDTVEGGTLIEGAVCVAYEKERQTALLERKLLGSHLAPYLAKRYYA